MATCEMSWRMIYDDLEGATLLKIHNKTENSKKSNNSMKEIVIHQLSWWESFKVIQIKVMLFLPTKKFQFRSRRCGVITSIAGKRR